MIDSAGFNLGFDFFFNPVIMKNNICITKNCPGNSEYKNKSDDKNEYL